MFDIVNTLSGAVDFLCITFYVLLVAWVVMGFVAAFAERKK